MLMLFSRKKPIRVMFSRSAILTAMLVGADRPGKDLEAKDAPLFAPFQNSAATRQLPGKLPAFLSQRTSAPITLSKALCRPMSSAEARRFCSKSKMHAECVDPVRGKMVCLASKRSFSANIPPRWMR